MFRGPFYGIVLFTLIAATRVLVVNTSSTGTLSKISIEGSWFLDEFGRVRMFHGLNAVSKKYPWIPLDRPNLQNTTELDNLKRWGFNVVRLGLMWTGLRPTRDTVNLTYFNEMVDIIDNLAARGIYVIIDLHQDMLSSKFGAYDGCPRWLIDSMPTSKKPYPWPFLTKDLSFAAYVTESCGFAFQNLYSNTNGFQDYFAEYWRIVAGKLKSYPSVLGYDLMNEPWAGDIYADPLLILPSRAGKFNLMPMYDNAYNVIRKVDNQTIVFYEPVTWGVQLNDKLLGTGFERAPANASQSTALSWHYYCWLYDIGSNKNTDLKRKACGSGQRVSSFDSINKFKRDIGTASFLTEFGSCIFRHSDGTQDFRECESVLEFTDKYMESWTYWNSDFYREDGQPNMGLLDTMSRVYALSTAGHPISFSYNTTSKLFAYSYWHDLKIQKPTEIFMPDHAYQPNGFQVKVSKHLTWSFDVENRLLLVTCTKPFTTRRYIQSEITISQKSPTGAGMSDSNNSIIKLI